MKTATAIDSLLPLPTTVLCTSSAVLTLLLALSLQCTRNNPKNPPRQLRRHRPRLLPLRFLPRASFRDGS